MTSLGQVIGGFVLLFFSCTVASAGGIGGKSEIVIVFIDCIIW